MKTLNTGISLISALFWIAMVVLAMSDFATATPLMGVAKIAFAFIVIFHAFRMAGFVSLRFYAIAASISILAIILSGVFLDNGYMVLAGICLALILFIFLTEKFFRQRYGMRGENSDFGDPV